MTPSEVLAQRRAHPREHAAGNRGGNEWNPSERSEPTSKFFVMRKFTFTFFLHFFVSIFGSQCDTGIFLKLEVYSLIIYNINKNVLIKIK